MKERIRYLVEPAVARRLNDLPGKRLAAAADLLFRDCLPPADIPRGKIIVEGSVLSVHCGKGLHPQFEANVQDIVIISDGSNEIIVTVARVAGVWNYNVQERRLCAVPVASAESAPSRRAKLANIGRFRRGPK